MHLHGYLSSTYCSDIMQVRYTHVDSFLGSKSCTANLADILVGIGENFKKGILVDMTKITDTYSW